MTTLQLSFLGGPLHVQTTGGPPDPEPQPDPPDDDGLWSPVTREQQAFLEQPVTQARHVTPPQHGTLAERTRLTADRLAYLAEGTPALCRRHAMWRSFRTWRDHYDVEAAELVR